ncbi:hypothetical protein PILCRDRAFT_5187 [Piloderma croceum F 1598]|uniref:DUF6534 domain-containing protein n=1 Tax=Piloderma croceum (strain F 1598) TaxID=765440 RepID=A0A0C3FPT6_PILCF|nr:hypothetical protein PILCRDRAFT_5187 [Piloderma croceum F 1598]
MTDTFSMRDINVTLRALEAGVLICMFLLGASTVQAYVYYGKFPLDPWPVKALVASVLALEWGHSICVAHTFYVLSILQYGHVEELVRLPLSLKLSILLYSAVSSIVQLFFADRIRRFSGRSFIAVCCWILTFWRLGLGIWAMVGALKTMNLYVFNRKYRLSMMFYALGTAIDLTIAVSLVCLLMKHSKSSFKKTVRLIDNLIDGLNWCSDWMTSFYATDTISSSDIEITRLTSIALFICFVVMPNNYVWLALYSYMDRAYSNSLLALLNSRGTRSRTQQQQLVISDVEGLGTPIAPRFAPVITIEMTERSDTTNSRSSDEGHGHAVIQKGEFLGEKK